MEQRRSNTVHGWSGRLCLPLRSKDHYRGGPRRTETDGQGNERECAVDTLAAQKTSVYRRNLNEVEFALLSELHCDARLRSLWQVDGQAAEG